MSDEQPQAGQAALTPEDVAVKPIPEEYRAQMQGLARGIDEVLGGLHFALFMFTMREDGQTDCNFISNSERPGVMEAVKAWLVRAEAQEAALRAMKPAPEGEGS